jgi:hypothetical protein
MIEQIIRDQSHLIWLLVGWVALTGIISFRYGIPPWVELSELAVSVGLWLFSLLIIAIVTALGRIYLPTFHFSLAALVIASLSLDPMKHVLGVTDTGKIHTAPATVEGGPPVPDRRNSRRNRRIRST